MSFAITTSNKKTTEVYPIDIVRLRIKISKLAYAIASVLLQFSEDTTIAYQRRRIAYLTRY